MIPFRDAVNSEGPVHMRTFENVKVKDCYSIQTVEVSDKLLVSFLYFFSSVMLAFVQLTRNGFY